jgi:hypothetical protein
MPGTLNALPFRAIASTKNKHAQAAVLARRRGHFVPAKL